MSASKVAIRYASSFLDSSIEKNTLDRVSEDFEFVYDTLRKNKELIRFIKSPIVKNETKQSVLSAIFQSKIGKESLEFMLFVATKGRENILLDILEKFFEIRDEHFKIARISVITSFEFTPEQKIQIEKQFEKLLNKKVYMTYSVDNNLVGGFVAKAGDTIYDASVIHQLELLKKQFLLGNISLN